MNAPDRFSTTRIKALDGMPVQSLHVAIFIAADKILTDDTLRLVSFSGKEAISDNFEFDLELHGNTSKSWENPLSFADLIGRPITVGVQAPALNATGHQPSRDEASGWFQSALAGQAMFPRLSLFNGIVAAFAIDKPGVYRVTMRPALWKLSLTNAYRVHARLNVRDAIAALMERHRIDYSVAALMGSDNPAVTRVQDWLQAGESDEEFLRRLMSRAHVYAYFVHGARSHQVVFANRPAYPEALPAGQLLRYCDTEFEENALPQADTLTRYSFKQSLVSGTVDGILTREEAAWEADAVAGMHSYRAASRSASAPLPFVQYQIVQYGGSDAEIDHYSHATQDALDASASEFSGASLCPHLRCGYRFAVTQQPREGQRPATVRPELEGRSFVLTQVQHEASLDGLYRNEFIATDAATLVTAFSLHDTQQGSVLAEVVAANGSPPRSDWRYGTPSSCDPESADLIDRISSPSSLNARGVMVRLSTAAPDDPPVWIKLAAHMQTVPEVGATVVVARAQDQTELPEIQSIIQSNVSQVIMPSGWTASTSVGSNYNTTYGDGKSIRFGLHSQANLDQAVGIVEGQYRSGQYREASFAQGASYSYSTSESGPAGLLSRSDSFGSTYSSHEGAVSSSTTTFATTDTTSVVTALANNSSSHAVVMNTSMTGLQTDLNLVGATTRTSLTGASAGMSITGSSADMNVVGEASHLNVTGVSSGVSVTEASVEVSQVGVSSVVAMRGVSSSIEITGVGFSAQIASALISVKIVALEITL